MYMFSQYPTVIPLTAVFHLHTFMGFESPSVSLEHKPDMFHLFTNR